MAIKSFTTKPDADGNCYPINREACTFVRVKTLSDRVENYKAGCVQTGSVAAGRVVYAPIRRQDVLEAMGL
jgi:hypothetical protein